MAQMRLCSTDVKMRTLNILPPAILPWTHQEFPRDLIQSQRQSCALKLVSTGICCYQTAIWLPQENPLPWHSFKVSLQTTKPQVARTSEGLSELLHQTETHEFQHRTEEMTVKLGNIPSWGGVFYGLTLRWACITFISSETTNTHFYFEKKK